MMMMSNLPLFSRNKSVFFKFIFIKGEEQINYLFLFVMILYLDDTAVILKNK